jgi:hypothetical protein
VIAASPSVTRYSRYERDPAPLRGRDLGQHEPRHDLLVQALGDAPVGAVVGLLEGRHEALRVFVGVERQQPADRMQPVGVLVHLLALAADDAGERGDLPGLAVDQLRGADRARGVLAEERQQEELAVPPRLGPRAVHVERPSVSAWERSGTEASAR